MKRNSILVMGFVCLMLTATVAFAGGNREREEPEQTAPESTQIATEDLVARVNGRGVLREEFDNVIQSNIERYEAQSGEPFPQEQRVRLERQVLDGLITRTVLEAEAEDRNISVSNERLAQTLEQFRGQFPDEDAYRMALEQQGFTQERFEDELRRQLVIEQLIESQAFSDLSVAEAELRAFYDDNPDYFSQPEQVEARHIILTTQDASEEERAAAREQIEDIRSQIMDGAAFGEMAREYSQDGSAAQGGSLGTFGRGQMVPAFEEVVFSLEVGAISGVVETQFGYHLVQVTERIPGRTVAFDDARSNIEEFILEDARNEAAQQYVARLREAAEVEELIEIE